MNNRLLPLPDTVDPAATAQACLLVADLVGSTRLARVLPLPHYMALMTDLIQVLMLHFEAYGGQVLQHQGDALVCLFSPAQVPAALRAAQGSHVRAGQLRLAEWLGQTLRLRVGLALGEVLTGTVGGTFSTYGLPVNLARRLCSAAEPGETLICPSLLPYVPALKLRERALDGLPGFEELSLAYRVMQGPPTVQKPAEIEMKTG
ncbi:adenylate/guanylate cyclase domain-containing protein [Deinococcus sp.]|uniref:adenylate/guanylate cyclase domain-containing protein n=1 Tax=Deinococcus sp. TaxID=47478 RepID=UPI003CC516FB